MKRKHHSILVWKSLTRNLNSCIQNSILTTREKVGQQKKSNQIYKQTKCNNRVSIATHSLLHTSLTEGLLLLRIHIQSSLTRVFLLLRILYKYNKWLEICNYIYTYIICNYFITHSQSMKKKTHLKYPFYPRSQMSDRYVAFDYSDKVAYSQGSYNNTLTHKIQILRFPLVNPTPLCAMSICYIRLYTSNLCCTLYDSSAYLSCYQFTIVQLGRADNNKLTVGQQPHIIPPLS